MRIATVLLATLSIAFASPAQAWTRPGHMVTAAIAWKEVEAHRPDLIGPLGQLLAAHPDRGPFQLAIDRTTGAEQTRRMLLQCARWSDDIRETPQDQPSWHAAVKPVVKPGAPPPPPADQVSGQAIEALRLNFAVAGNPRASAAERARALCWVMHVGADIHQPLHVAELFSSAYPKGDGGGGRQFVKDPETGEPISLHWMWDDSVNRSGQVADVDARASEIMGRYPRVSLKEAAGPAADFAGWAAESYALATSAAYTGAIPTGARAATAVAVPEAAYRDVRSVAARRVALAGYRLADLLIAILDAAAEPR